MYCRVVGTLVIPHAGYANSKVSKFAIMTWTSI
jgi:hypothetical protein